MANVWERFVDDVDERCREYNGEPFLTVELGSKP